jgi:hypothetical protein
MSYLTSNGTDLSVGDIDVTNWHHIVYTKALDRTGKMYINGQKVVEGTFADNSYNYSALYLAASYFTSWGGHFKGWIDELRVSNIVRSETEINNYYNSGVEFAIDGNTIGLWHFNEASGTSFSNAISGSGTLLNGASFTSGKFGNGVYFDGINDRGNCNINIPEDDITIEFWVKLDGKQDTTIIQPYGIFSSNIHTSYLCDETLDVQSYPVNENKIVVYPNPINNLLNLKNESNGELLIEIIDYTGRVILKQKLNGRLNTIDTSNFITGVYFLNMTTNSKRTIKKIIKQ